MNPAPGRCRLCTTFAAGRRAVTQQGDEESRTSGPRGVLEAIRAEIRRERGVYESIIQSSTSETADEDQ
jgi:hypothetical protein